MIHYITSVEDSTKVLYNSDSDSVVNDYLTKYHHIAIDTKPLVNGQYYDYKIIHAAGSDTVTGTFYSIHNYYNDSTYTFCAYGNSYGNAADHQTICEKIYAENPKFVVHLGNVTATGDDISDYTTYFLDVIDTLTNNDIPFFNVIGTNERVNTYSKDTTRLFIQPSLCMESVRSYYASWDTVQDYTTWDLYPAVFATWNTEQEYWLKDDSWQHGFMTTVPGYSHAKFGVYFSHDSPYISGATSNTNFRGRLDSLMSRHDFQVSISAGANFYQRSHLGDKIYLCAGLGGATAATPTSDSSYVDYSYNSAYGYLVGYVNADSLHIKFKNISGTVIDSVTVTAMDYACKPFITWDGDAGTQRTIQFTTFTETNGKVRYTPDFSFSTWDSIETSSTRDHVFRLTELTRDTTYYYKCFYTGFEDANTYSFETPGSDDTLKIVLFGDWGMGRYPRYNEGQWLTHFHLWDWLERGITDADFYLQLGEGIYYSSTIRSLVSVLPYFNQKPLITNRTEQRDTTIRMQTGQPFYSYARWGKVGIFTLLQSQYPTTEMDPMLDWFEDVLDTVTAPIIISNGHFQAYERDSFDVAAHIAIEVWIDSLVWDRYWSLCDDYNVLGFYSHRAQIDGEEGRDGLTRWERLDRKIGRKYDVSINNSFNAYEDAHQQGVLILQITADNEVSIIRHEFMPLWWYATTHNDTISIGKFASKKFKRYKINDLFDE